MLQKTNRGILLAVCAAALYAINAPLSKLLLNDLPPTLMAGFLYFGAGIGIGLLSLLPKKEENREAPLTRSELPYTLAMIALDIAAPICLLLGLSRIDAASASLLNNFEIVATACIALLLFRENISPRLWLGIGCVTLSCMLLSFEDLRALRLSPYALFILLAAVLWGLENNCTRKISSKNPLQIVLLKGFFSGLGSLGIGFFAGERPGALSTIFLTLLLGFVAYGLSIFCYVYAQRMLGAARTSAYYAFAPFIGVLLSFLIFRALPHPSFFAALAIMILGAWLSSNDTPLFHKCRNKKRNRDSEHGYQL